MIPKVEMTLSKFYELLRSKEAHSMSMTSYIDTNGLQHFVNEDDYISYLGIVDSLLLRDDITIKIEKYDQLCNSYPHTCHIFYAKSTSPSFNTHTDPVDLVIQVTHGSKTMIINGKEIVAHKGHCLYIPANTPHCATNKFESIMLSWGLHDHP